MKTTLVSAVLLILAVTIQAQPVLEHTYTVSANICCLENTGNVYYTMDVTNKQCRIFKMDHSLYKTISLPTPEGYYLCNVQFVSENLFNEDNLIELVYTYSKYVPTTESYYYTYESKLINENGTLLLSFPGAGLTELTETMDAKKKFLVYIYDFSLIPFTTQTKVYSLPKSTMKSGEVTARSFETGNPYPNPASGSINLPVYLPATVQSGVLNLYDVRGNRMISQPFTGSSQNIVILSSALDPGTYIYNIKAGEMQSTSKKIVIEE